MIHSGGALGGHYYAYIKDIETGKWYNFNDSTVREISIIDVVEAFGPEKTSANLSRMAQRRLANARQANAYMLMYRIIDPAEDKNTLFVHEDEIPEDVREDVEKVETTQAIARTEKEKKAQKMNLKAVYKPSKKVLPDGVDFEQTQKVFFVDRAEDTYRDLFDMVYKDFIGDNPEKSRKNFRLRMYQEATDIMLDTYTGREDLTLELLKIYPMRTLALEEKAPEDEFEDYDPDSI